MTARMNRPLALVPPAPLSDSFVPPPPTPLPRTRRALVVDDDALARTMLHDALAERGFEVVTAVDGAAALRKLCEELLDLDILVSDLFMPALDGAALVKRIRGPGGEVDLAVLIVTSAPPAEFLAMHELGGADAVLRKELGPEAIAWVADAVVRQRDRERPADR
jgi:CheY-like chemotaxis protein